MPSLSFCPYICVTAANQKEALKSGFCVKEEPEAEEALSPARCPSFSLGHDASAGPGRPLQEGSILRHDINVKVASELLMKLSGKALRLVVMLWLIDVERNDQSV